MIHGAGCWKYSDDEKRQTMKWCCLTAYFALLLIKSVMVLAFVGQVTYIGLISFVCFTTLTSMFTPEWRSFVKENDRGNDKDAINSGIIFCYNLDIGTCLSKHSGVDSIILICLILALLFEFAALGWAIASLLTCFIQKLRKFLFYPLPGLSGAISLFLFLAILLFVLKADGQIEFDINAKVGQGAYIGYSFYVCCISLIFAIFSLGAGIWTAFFLEKD